MCPLVYVIILNWNRCDDVLECLSSWESQTYSNFRLVVVDNGSTDGSVEAIRDRFPRVIVLCNSVNLGFAEGNNVGIQYALGQGADYVLLLNNDTVIAPDFLQQLIAVAETDERIGAVGPKIHYYSDPQRIWCAGGSIGYTETVTRQRGYRQLDRGQFERVEDVDYLTGCALMMRSRAIEKIGMLDPVYSPAYFEDTDWCVRARRAGYRCVFVPSAELRHKVSMSSGGAYNAQERYLLGFNSITFMRRYAGRTHWIKFMIFAFGSWPAVFVVRTCQGRGRAAIAKLVGLIDGLRGSRRNTFLNP